MPVPFSGIFSVFSCWQSIFSMSSSELAVSSDSTVSVLMFVFPCLWHTPHDCSAEEWVGGRAFLKDREKLCPRWLSWQGSLLLSLTLSFLGAILLQPSSKFISLQSFLPLVFKCLWAPKLNNYFMAFKKNLWTSQYPNSSFQLDVGIGINWII